MTEQDTHAWRDERKLPLAELVQAMATYSHDGQIDDMTGADAGAEAEFGHGPRPVEHTGGSGSTRDERPAAGDPDPTSEAGRRLRPSPDGASGVGRSGPH
jgi:hypothetical protein